LETNEQVEPIVFEKITDPRDIDTWIQQRAADPAQIQAQYQREMVVIGQDWTAHGLDTTKGYVLSFGVGRMSWGTNGLEAASYRVLFSLPNTGPMSTHGIYFVLDDKGQIVDVVRTTPQIEEQIALNKQFMQ
jgi:hypothetical protein